MNQHLWYKNAVFYQLYIRAFSDSNGDGHGDLNGVTQKLDYLQGLGVDCIWLMPFYPSPLKDDGYDIADYYNIHPDYGTLDDFKVLLAEAHKREIRIITDLVLNHTSDQHPWFQAARADRNSPYRDYYVWSDSDKKYADARIIFLDTEKSNWSWDATAGQYFWHRFYSSQPDLNYENPAVCAEVFNIMKFWLDLGVDGFRADAVPYLFERDGTDCENLYETHRFLKDMRLFIDKHYQDRILLCEANQWPSEVRAYFGDSDEFQMAFHFPLMPRIFMALRRELAEPIRTILEQTPAIPDDCQWCTFLRNHDELTLEMVSPEERQWMRDEYAPDPSMRINLGIRRRLAPLLGNDQRLILLANSLLFTLPGSPVIYYGDEIGMGDNLELPDRNGVRTPMQWDNTPNAGFSLAPASRLYAPVINDHVYGPEKVSVELARSSTSSLWKTLDAMIATRKAHPGLGLGNFAWLDCRNPAIAAYLRSYGDEIILVANNLSAKKHRVRLPCSAPVTDLLTGRKFIPENRAITVYLKPYQYLWLKYEQQHV